MDFLTCDTCHEPIDPNDYFDTDESGDYCGDCTDTYVNTMMQRAADQLASGVIFLDDYRQTFYDADLPY